MRRAQRNTLARGRGSSRVPSFQDGWQEGSIMWLNGFTGSGKLVLCSTAIQFALRHRRSDPKGRDYILLFHLHWRVEARCIGYATSTAATIVQPAPRRRCRSYPAAWVIQSRHTSIVRADWASPAPDFTRCISYWTRLIGLSGFTLRSLRDFRCPIQNLNRKEVELLMYVHWRSRSLRLPPVMQLHISWYCYISSHWFSRMLCFDTDFRTRQPGNQATAIM